MESESKNIVEDERTDKGEEKVFDFWSDEGARLFNEMIEDGSAYAWAHSRFTDFEEDLDYEQSEYVDPDLRDPDEETLTPGEMEIIMENCYIN